MLDLNLREGHYDADINYTFTKWDDRFALFEYIVAFLSMAATLTLIILQACKTIDIGWWWPFSPLVFSTGLILVVLSILDYCQNKNKNN